MTGRGSIRHNNRSFSAANVDRSRTEQNIVFCNEDLKQVYHMVFDEALAAYNAKKTKTRDKIPDYYEHIRQSKQEKLFHEVIFQIGNREDMSVGTDEGDLAVKVLNEYVKDFQKRNPTVIQQIKHCLFRHIKTGLFIVPDNGINHIVLDDSGTLFYVKNHHADYFT